MEKRRPHCRLETVKAMAAAGKWRTTFAASKGALALGLDIDAMLAVVVGLEPRDFHKSMTSYANHRIWQDVYRPKTAYGSIYLK